MPHHTLAAHRATSQKPRSGRLNCKMVSTAPPGCAPQFLCTPLPLGHVRPGCARGAWHLVLVVVEREKFLARLDDGSRPDLRKLPLRRFPLTLEARRRAIQIELHVAMVEASAVDERERAHANGELGAPTGAVRALVKVAVHDRVVVPALGQPVLVLLGDPGQAARDLAQVEQLGQPLLRVQGQTHVRGPPRLDVARAHQSRPLIQGLQEVAPCIGATPIAQAFGQVTR